MDNHMIPLSEPHLNGTEWKYVKDCLDTGWVSTVGEYVHRFENFCAQYVGRKYGVACNNGTAALHTALMVCGIKPGHEVIIPTLTFVAPANAVRYTGAFPCFIDAEKNYWQLDVEKLNNFLAKECSFANGELVNKHTKRTIKAVIAVDILGHPVDMDALLALARQYGLIVIEDNAESLGSRYKQKPTGKTADIVALSFNGNKIVTAGGGGMVLTDRKEWADRARYLTTQAKDDGSEYIHQEVGYNYRLTNIQAAMGLAQMEHLDEYVSLKRSMALTYTNSFNSIKNVTPLKEAPWAESSFWLYTILWSENSRPVIKYLHEQGIQARPLWHPIHSLKPFEDCFAYSIETANDLYSRAISLPSSVGITKDQQAKVIEGISKYI
jgi:perosamine synthetase